MKKISCSGCPWEPEPILPINQDVWQVWVSVQTQWRAGGFGLIGLDYVAVEAEAERQEIELSRCDWLKLKALEHYELGRHNKHD